jgi:hypothetical protein
MKSDIALMRQILEPFTRQDTKVQRGVGQRFSPQRAVGTHWSSNDWTAEDYGPVVLHAIVQPDQIDWLHTIARGAFFWAPNVRSGYGRGIGEHELSIIRGTIMKVDVFRSGELYRENVTITI